MKINLTCVKKKDDTEEDLHKDGVGADEAKIEF